MSDKKILIITYYWPPSGGSGVQRWLKFVKYLPQFGITPYVFTPENPSFDVRDESLLRDVPAEAEVIHFPIWEPYGLFFNISKWFGGAKSAKPTDLVPGKRTSTFQRLSTWLRGNALIPDPRVFWVRPSARFLHDFLRDNEINTVITTGPPHSVHLIGLNLKKKNPSLRWIADFRDPWSEWGFLDSLMAGTIARRIHRYLESRVLQKADIVTTITPFYVRSFSKLGGRKVELLTNGYDEEDFLHLAPVKGNNYVIRHVGIVNEKCNPRPFMEAVRAAMKRSNDFRMSVIVDFVGEVHPSFRAYVNEDDELKAITTFTPPVPHKELIRMYNHSSLLLLVLEGYKDAEGYMPGKLFEYLATNLPVMGVGPEDGDAADLMRKTGCGEMVSGKNIERIGDVLLRNFERWQQSALPVNTSGGFLAYSRKSLTEQLTRLIN